MGRQSRNRKEAGGLNLKETTTNCINIHEGVRGVPTHIRPEKRSISLKDGLSKREIAKCLGVSRTPVIRLLGPKNRL